MPAIGPGLMIQIARMSMRPVVKRHPRDPCEEKATADGQGSSRVIVIAQFGALEGHYVVSAALRGMVPAVADR